jgi:hypothetical protein
VKSFIYHGKGVMDVVVIQSGDVPGTVVVVQDNEGSRMDCVFHASDTADEDELVDVEDFAGGEMRFVINIVWRGVILVARDEDESSRVHVGFSEGG